MFDEINRAMNACKSGDDAKALTHLKLAVWAWSFAVLNLANGHTNRGRKPGAKQKHDPDAAAVQFVADNAATGSLRSLAGHAIEHGLAPAAESFEALRSAKERIVRKAKAEIARRTANI